MMAASIVCAQVCCLFRDPLIEWEESGVHWNQVNNENMKRQKQEMMMSEIVARQPGGLLSDFEAKW